jgi:hypothetical protein
MLASRIGNGNVFHVGAVANIEQSAAGSVALRLATSRRQQSAATKPVAVSLQELQIQQSNQLKHLTKEKKNQMPHSLPSCCLHNEVHCLALITLSCLRVSWFNPELERRAQLRKYNAEFLD